jgi:hypothetical protein
MNALEKNMKSLNVVDCPNNREVIVRERAVDKITRTFAFDRVFGPNSKQVSMSVFINVFIFLTLVHLLSLLLLHVIYIDFSVCIISCRKLGGKTLGVASSNKTFILNLMKIDQLAQNWTVFGH